MVERIEALETKHQYPVVQARIPPNAVVSRTLVDEAVCASTPRGSDVDRSLLGLGDDGNIDADETILGHRNKGAYRTVALHSDP